MVGIYYIICLISVKENDLEKMKKLKLIGIYLPNSPYFESCSVQ